MQANQPQVSVRRSGSQSPEPFPSEFVSGNYFSLLVFIRTPGARRRLPTRTPARLPVPATSYRAWEQHGSDPSVVGSTFMIDGNSFTVVGDTAPAGFFGDRLRENPAEFYVPLAFEPLLTQGSSLLHIDNQYWLYLIGRMKPGAQPAQVQAQLNTPTAAVASLDCRHAASACARPREIDKQVIKLGPGGAGITELRETYKSGLFMLIAASALVLLIACANLANLLLARGMARRQQSAVQIALGASRGRLIRGVLTESILLACMGGAAGLALAYWGTHAILLVAFRGSNFVPIATTPSPAVLGFAFGLSLITGIIFGVAPAWMTSHSDPADALRGANRSTRDSNAMPQKSLVIAQAALSLVLLAMAGLVTQSLRNLENYSFGFETDGRLMVSLDPMTAGYTVDRLPGLYQQFRDRLGQIPGVRSVAYSMYSPQDGDSWNDNIVVEGKPESDNPQDEVGWLRVSPEYFKTIGTRLLRGRTIDERDTAASQRVAVVDENFVRRHFPDRDPIGQHFGFGARGNHGGDFEIIGVVANTRYRAPNDANYPQNPMFFLPYFQEIEYEQPLYTRMQAQSEYASVVEISYSGSQAEIASQVRQVLASIDPNLSIIDMHSFGEQVKCRQFNQERLIARLTELFSLLALLLHLLDFTVLRPTTSLAAPARLEFAWPWAPIAATWF